MAHNIDFSTGRAAFAYVGERAWHGHGQKLQPGASMAQWAEASGLNFEVFRAVVEYQAGEHGYKASARDHVLFRSDTGERLGIVSDEYKIVQPGDALEFFREFCEANQLEMETAADVKPERAIRGLADLEQSYVAAPGACPGTAYGVLQGVTHFIDHVRGSDARRQQSAWFGQGETLKATAFEQLLAKA